MMSRTGLSGPSAAAHVKVLSDEARGKVGVFVSDSKSRRTEFPAVFVAQSVNHVIHGLQALPYQRGQSNDTTKVKIRLAPSTTKL